MPQPVNLETALSVEAIIRQGGVVLTTIAILDAPPVLGASEAEIERLATETGFVKAKRSRPRGGLRFAGSRRTT